MSANASPAAARPDGDGPPPHETASHHLVTETPTAAPAETVGETLARLPGHRYAFAGTLCIVDDDGRFVGLAAMADLLAAEPDTPIGVLQNGDEPPAVHLWADQEMVALMAIRHGLAAVPVVDDDGRFQGVVPPQTLAEILRAEHIEDIHRIVGISRTSERTLDAMRAPPVYQLKRRLPWLLVGLLGCVFATAVVARFEAELESRIAIAFFVPGLVYLAGAIGTQSEAIAVRGLSLTHLPMARLLLDEFGTGLLIGLALAVLSFPLIWLGFGDIRLALAVGLSLIAAGGTATATGLALPWIFWRAGWDPALGGGPMCTIIQDVLSLVVYFWMASWLLL